MIWEIWLNGQHAFNMHALNLLVLAETFKECAFLNQRVTVRSTWCPYMVYEWKDWSFYLVGTFVGEVDMAKV